MSQLPPSITNFLASGQQPAWKIPRGDWSGYIQGTWKRNLEWREFGLNFKYLNTSNTIVSIQELPSSSSKAQTRVLRWSFGRKIPSQKKRLIEALAEQPEGTRCFDMECKWDEHEDDETSMSWSVNNSSCSGWFNPSCGVAMLRSSILIKQVSASSSSSTPSTSLVSPPPSLSSSLSSSSSSSLSSSPLPIGFVTPIGTDDSDSFLSQSVGSRGLTSRPFNSEVPGLPSSYTATSTMVRQPSSTSTSAVTSASSSSKTSRSTSPERAITSKTQFWQTIIISIYRPIDPDVCAVTIIEINEIGQSSLQYGNMYRIKEEPR